MFDGLCHNQAEVAVNTIVQLCATIQRLRGGTDGGWPINKKDMKEMMHVQRVSRSCRPMRRLEKG